MTLSRHLDWPFFEDTHREVDAEVARWIDERGERALEEDDSDRAVIEAVSDLGRSGFLRRFLPSPTDSGPRLDVRSICLIRENLAAHSGLADVAFAMQGLGSAPISLFGSEELQARYVQPIAAGAAIAAFAISEVGAGSDVAAVSTTAKEDGDRWIIDGEKTWISNAPIADVFVVFARTENGEGSRCLSAFVVPSTARGLHVERLNVSGPHPIGTVAFEDVSVPSDHLIGERGQGFKVAMATLGRFRPSVGAAALGFARRALAEALTWTDEREIAGRKLADYDMTRERLADMALTIDAGALLVYRAAWLLDCREGRHSRETSMAKLFATEGAQAVVDSAIQLLGARGLVAGSSLESLYREVRALRIYEGTSEVQKLLVARDLLAEQAEQGASLGRAQR